ncbi:hypothetical protein M3588_26590, partial [Cytobacillus sp. AMY 15.2]|nr:hypothetical protein [Cytobacillus sp. AMY 15.2]
VDAVERELLREAHGEVEEKPARLKSPAPQAIAHAPGATLDPNTLAGVCAAPGIAVGRWCVSTMRTSCRPSRRPARRPRKAAASTRR